MKFIGEYTEGEKPLPLVVTFKRKDGSVIVVSGMNAAVNLRKPSGGIIADNATVTDGPAGQVTYTWGETATHLIEPGKWFLEVWVGDGTNLLLASELFSLWVRPALQVASV